MYTLPNLAAALALLASFGPAHAADAGTHAPRKDAAEAVQEGNVRLWIEYYERERRKAQRPTPPEPTPATSGTEQRLPEDDRH
jgi:hypothetical protein